jgi:hypothetical protein
MLKATQFTLLTEIMDYNSNKSSVIDCDDDDDDIYDKNHYDHDHHHETSRDVMGQITY